MRCVPFERGLHLLFFWSLMWPLEDPLLIKQVCTNQINKLSGSEESVGMNSGTKIRYVFLLYSLEGNKVLLGPNICGFPGFAALLLMRTTV